jgi:hypothetical protein
LQLDTEKEREREKDTQSTQNTNKSNVLSYVPLRPLLYINKDQLLILLLTLSPTTLLFLSLLQHTASCSLSSSSKTFSLFLKTQPVVAFGGDNWVLGYIISCLTRNPHAWVQLMSLGSWKFAFLFVCFGDFVKWVQWWSKRSRICVAVKDGLMGFSGALFRMILCKPSVSFCVLIYLFYCTFGFVLPFFFF